MQETEQVVDRTPDERVADWEQRTRVVIVLAALAPFAAPLIAGADREALLWVDLVAWAVFTVDLIVHIRLKPDYWRTGRGVFDIAIVFFTFPWYVIPAIGNTAFMAVFRLARILRLLEVGHLTGNLLLAVRRMGSLGLGLLATSLVASVIVLRSEPPDSGYETFGDAMWWSIVSFTTVGYGDLFPTTLGGRMAGGLMMLMGLAALGTVSAVFAATLMGQGDSEEETALENRILDELEALRTEVSDLRQHLGAETMANATKSATGVPEDTLRESPDEPDRSA